MLEILPPPQTLLLIHFHSSCNLQDGKSNQYLDCMDTRERKLSKLFIELIQRWEMQNDKSLGALWSLRFIVLIASASNKPKKAPQTEVGLGGLLSINFMPFALSN